ncbi:MAG: trehalose utilization protein ThuA, partial [Lentisphaerae bacterium]|nr:trehalose utilization protein ThuA [Lentisphaerota bacterium]
MNVTIWNEFRHEKMEGEGGDAVRKCYPEGIHEFLRKALAPQMEDCVFNTAWLDQDENGLPDEVLNKTDVLVWWGHIAHGDVSDEIVDKVQERVLGGMGLVVLHSGHLAKVFRRMLGTGCTLRWREIGEKERVWVTDPSHPIAAGVPDSFVVEQTEMYGEPFDIPDDGHVVFMSWYEGGNVFRSGVTFNRGLGKIFYFSPGHESLPIYHNKDVQKVIVNGI